MPYTPQVWTDLPTTTTPLDAARLNYIEAGIETAQATADAAPSVSADNTWTGTNTFGLFSAGFGAVDSQGPSNESYVIDASHVSQAGGGEVIGSLRQTVFTGNWHPKASVVINATGGTAAWTIGGQTASIAATASAATVQAALQALTSVGGNYITVTGGPGNSGGTNPYIVTYSDPIFWSGHGFSPLSINGASLTGGTGAATLTWSNGYWGGDTGLALGGNDYRVTGGNAGDGDGLLSLEAAVIEADVRSNATIGIVTGLAAEASFEGANAAGATVGTIRSMHIHAPLHKDGALPFHGTATAVYGLYVGAVTGQRVFTDGVTTSGNNVITSAVNFSVWDVGKVITGAGIPANTYVMSAGANSLTLSQNCTANASGVTVTVQANSQASTAYTAYFEPGSIGINGATSIVGWKDEVQFTVQAYPGGSQAVTQWKNGGGATVATMKATGTLSASTGVIAAEGLTGAMFIGPSGGKSVVTFGSAGDIVLTRQSGTLLSVSAGVGLQLGHAATGSRPASPAVGTVFYDTTLSKPIYYDGAAWRDAAGNAV